MPFTKVWLGTTGDYEEVTNWELISIRTNSYAWTVSGSGTNEYYVRTSAPANPGFQATPPTTNGVYINGTAATKGTLGALTAGQWGFGDNDTLGYSTVYVRLSDGTDPDSKDAHYVQFRQIPQATEHVRIPAGSGTISSNMDQSAVAIGDFIVESGYLNNIGASTGTGAGTGSLLIDPNRFEFNATSGTAYIDLFTAAIPISIIGTGQSSTPGVQGLNLRGSALTVIEVRGGQVGFAARPGEALTATTLRIIGKTSRVIVGNGVTLTNLHQFDGQSFVRCAVTTTILYGGKVTTEENGAFTTITQHGGEHIYNTSGTITTYNLYGGTLDEQQSGAARTISTLNKYRGSSIIRRNKESVTHTAETTQESYTESISP